MPSTRIDPPKNLSHHSHLTSRELEVLSLIVEGKSNPQIAKELYVSPSTIKSHVNGILNKLSVNDRVQAAVFAVRNQLI